MQITVPYDNKNFKVDLSNYLDISIPIGGNEVGVKAWYVDAPEINPVTDGDFIGEVAQGSSVNFRNIFFNPHAHGTHTECMGHISETIYSVNKNLKEYYFVARLLSVTPTEKNGDRVIEKSQLQEVLGGRKRKAVIIRTQPNSYEKLSTNYSHTNPAYLAEDAAAWLAEIGVEHLLIDTPSVDREEDKGALKAHKAFWNYPNLNRLHCTITEFVFVPDSVPDANYFMNLQTAPIENDASPSRPILHQMTLIE